MKSKSFVHSKPTSKDKADVALNKAFDELNLCALQTKSVPSEVGDIVTGAVRSVAQLYKNSYQLYQAGEFEASRKEATVSYEMCQLLSFLTEEKTDNILNLPTPPRMPSSHSKMMAGKSEKIHPSLSLLNAYIRRRLTSGSKYYKSRLLGFSHTLENASKYLSRLEEIH